MTQGANYWLKRQVSRRAALRTAATATGGLAALSLIGCGGDDEETSSGPPAASATEATQPQAQATDPLSGEQGGKLILQDYADWGGLVLVSARQAGIHRGASYTHSGLYQSANGVPGTDPLGVAFETDLATDFPEISPDTLTYTVKIVEGAKFHNGRELTAEDVKYSYERYAFWEDSAYQRDFPWLDKVEAPDASTVIFTAKYPFADGPASLGGRAYGHILAREHEEGPDAVNKLMGSGAYIFVEREAPTLNARFRRNPEYFKQPLPYFDEIEVLGTSDFAKKVADFAAHNVHVTYWFDEENRDQIKAARPDATLFGHNYLGWAVSFRADLPPFNDQRVRRAASMLINRQQLIDGVYKGEGDDDQWFSWTLHLPMGEFRQPAELAGAEYWNHDEETAKQLLSAAGISEPLKMDNMHWDPTVVGQGMVDTNTLIATQWRNFGFIDSADIPLTFPQWASTVAIGSWENAWIAGPSAGGLILDPGMGNAIRNAMTTPPPEGPTPNNSKISDPMLDELLEKQIGQFDNTERLQTFKEMEDIMSLEQYKIVLNTFTNNFFADPSLRGIQIPLTHVQGSNHYIKYWWFEGGQAPS